MQKYFSQLKHPKSILRQIYTLNVFLCILDELKRKEMYLICLYLYENVTVGIIFRIKNMCIVLLSY